MANLEMPFPVQALPSDGLYASLASAAARLGAPLVAGARTRFPLKRPNRGEPLFLERGSCLPPFDRKPGLYYEARRRLEAAPGAQMLHAVRVRCVSHESPRLPPPVWLMHLRLRRHV
jgi:hypothetical protein